MGLFSGKVKTYVSSTIYNLAGDVDLRPNYVSAAIIGNVIADSSRSLGETLVASLIKGPGAQQRRFFRWAAAGNYALGMPTGSLGTSQSVSSAAVASGLAALIPPAANETYRVRTAQIDAADIDYWAEEWVRQNRPELTEEEWTADYDKTASEILIQIAEETDVHIAASDDLLWGIAETGRKLLFALYTIISEEESTGNLSESSLQFSVYRMGSGTLALDALEETATAVTEFFPAIPLRLNNVALTDSSLEDAYDAADTAFKKLTGESLDTLLENLEDNENIADIDYAFLVQGIPLNTPEKAAQEYLYNFFQNMRDIQSYTGTDFAAWKADQTERDISINRWNRYVTAHDPDRPYYPNVTTPEDDPVPITEPSYSELLITSEDLPEFDYRIRWIYIDETTMAGNAKTYDGDLTRGSLSKGEYWFCSGGYIEVPDPSATLYQNIEVETSAVRRYPRIFLFRQTSKFLYTRLEIVGMEHRNYVYKGHSVLTTAQSALLDEDEEESAFLVPLHYPTLTDLGLLKGTQLTTSCSYLVLNAYTEVKQKWYQTGAFKVIMVIATIAISILVPPAGALLGTGILGTNVAVGMAIGVGSATMAAIVGGVVNAIAGMIVSTLIQKFSTALFGDKAGAIIGTVLTFVAFSYGAQFAQTGNLNVDWSSLMRSENIIKLTDSVGNAYTNWLGADTQDMIEQASELAENYADELEKIEELSDEILGMTAEVIDPMMLTDTMEQFGETSSSFLNRTLLTGSDIAELTHGMISSFADISLELPTALT